MGLIISSLFATIQPTPEDGRNAVAVCVLSAIFLSCVPALHRARGLALVNRGAMVPAHCCLGGLVCPQGCSCTYPLPRGPTNRPSCSMSSAPQLAFAFLSKSTFYKQRDNHLFPAWNYSVAQARCPALLHRKGCTACLPAMHTYVPACQLPERALCEGPLPIAGRACTGYLKHNPLLTQLLFSWNIVPSAGHHADAPVNNGVGRVLAGGLLGEAKGWKPHSDKPSACRQGLCQHCLGKVISSPCQSCLPLSVLPGS